MKLDANNHVAQAINLTKRTPSLAASGVDAAAETRRATFAAQPEKEGEERNEEKDDGIDAKTRGVTGSPGVWLPGGVAVLDEHADARAKRATFTSGASPALPFNAVNYSSPPVSVPSRFPEAVLKAKEDASSTASRVGPYPLLRLLSPQR